MSEAPRLHALIERIANLLRQELRRAGRRHGLQPVQLEALHYLSICNRFSDTPLGVAEYLGLTKGTVSQTLKVLDSRGLVRRSPDSEDGRVVHLALTAAGQQALSASVPPTLLEAGLAAMPVAEARAITAAAERLLAGLQRANAGRSFGVCRSCRFHQPLDAGRARCTLIGAELSVTDAGRICREHQAAA